MEGLSVASAEDDSAADGSGGGGTAGGGGADIRRGEETRRCNAPRAARPPVSMYEAGSGVGGGGGRGGGGCGGHNRKINQQQQRHQQQQQQQLQQQHGGGKKQKKQQKWKANKYRGRGGGPDRKDCPARGGRKDKSTGAIGSQISGAGKPEDGTAPNGLVGEDQMHVAKGTASGEAQAQQTEQGCFHQVNQHGTSSIGNVQQQTSGALASSGVAGQQGTGGSVMSSAMPPQKNKHPKQQNLTPMEVRNKRLQSVSKFFLPDKRPRKECIVPPTKFLLGGNISDPLNLNSLQNESENAVTPKSSPIPTPPHYKAKIEVIIPPNINDPLHLLDPVDSVEYEMQLCSPMKRKQRTRNKRKRKSRTATERNADGLLSIDQLPPPPGADENVGGSGVAGGGAAKAEEATTAEEASFTGIGQKLADAAAGERFSLAPDMDTGSHFHHHHFTGQASSSGGSALVQQGHTNAAGVGTSVGPPAERNVASAGGMPTEQDREREKAMRNLKLDLESAGGRKRRTSESTNSTKNKLRRIDSMDKIVSPVIPQPGGWKRAHWPTNAGASGAAGNAGRNRTRTYSAASNADDLHGDEATDRGQVQDSQVHEKAHHSERLDASDDLTKKVLETGSSAAQEGVSTGEPVPAQHRPGTDIVSVDRPLSLVQGTAEGAIPQPHTALASSSRYFFGNYDRYYGYHSLNEFIDVRLKVFLRNAYLFRDKDVLDIGCNVGLMTISVAKLLHPKSATGIDVDGKLVAKARKNLSKYVRVPRNAGHVPGRRVNRESVTAVATATVTMEVSEEVNLGRNIIPLECNPLQLGVSEPDTVTAATTSQTGEESVVPVTITPSSVAENITVAEVPVVNEPPPGEHVLQPPAVVIQEEPDEEEMKDLKSPEMVDQPSQVKSEPVGTVPGPEHSSKFLLRQKRRRKRMAQKRRQHHQQHQHQQQHHQLRRQKTEQSQYFPISFPLTMGNLSGKEYQMDIGRTENKFPHNVRFKTMNYVVKEESLINYDTQQYDLILCLSVTKWIHLNYGDVGLKIAFKRMFNHLRPGGKLILEAQNWASYKKKKKLTATIFENYKRIEFMPSRFHDYLLSPEVGFSHSLPLGIPRHLSKGFRRPILLYIKGDFTPSQAKWSDTYNPGTPYENHRGIYTDIVTASQSAAGCIWGAMTPYAPSYSYRQPPTPSHGGGSGSGSGGFASTSPYYNPRQTDSYLPSYDNIGNGHRPGSYCFASPLYSTTWSPPSDMLATSGGGGGSYRRSASNTPNSASIRSADNDEHYYAGTAGGGSQRRHHVYPPIDVLPPLLGHDGMRPGSYRSAGGGGGGGAMTDSDSEPSSNSASQTPTRQQQLAGSFLTDDQSNSPSGHSQPDK
uniref:RNA methyltransferase n=1 Tax=Anopheles minimus TaxID=112268 RepID=A0A182WD20_9DIPT